MASIGDRACVVAAAAVGVMGQLGTVTPAVAPRPGPSRLLPPCERR